jgi:C-1 hydroxylase
MSAESNKAFVHQFLAAWNQSDMQRMTQLWAPNMLHHTRSGTYGPKEVFSLIAGFMQAFPDLEFHIDSMVAEGDFVATRMTASATHQQEFMGIPATGRQVSCSVMGLVRIVDGHIVEHWNVMDELFLLQQIGLVPDDYLTAMASS